VLAVQPTVDADAPSVPRSSTEKYLVFIAALLCRPELARWQGHGIEDRRVECHKLWPVASSEILG
jgi:hypothetical protein